MPTSHRRVLPDACQMELQVGMLDVITVSVLTVCWPFFADQQAAAGS
jgi:hypothetical protein